MGYPGGTGDHQLPTEKPPAVTLLPEHDLIDAIVAQPFVEAISPPRSIEMKILAPSGTGNFYEELPAAHPRTGRRRVHVRTRQRGPRFHNVRLIQVCADTEAVDDRLEQFSELLRAFRSSHYFGVSGSYLTTGTSRDGSGASCGRGRSEPGSPTGSGSARQTRTAITVMETDARAVLLRYPYLA